MKHFTLFTLIVLGVSLISCGTSHSSDNAKSRSASAPSDAYVYNSYKESQWSEMAKAEATRITQEKIADCGGDENITREEYLSCIQRTTGQMAPPLPSSSSRCISWTDANKHISKNTCIYGVVYTTYKDPNSGAFFIDFDNTRTSFYGVSFKWVWNGLKDQCVEIYGTIESYRGRPQIVIESTDQLKGCKR